MIICAATKVSGINKIYNRKDTIIIHGLRHGDCYSTLELFKKDWDSIECTDGFVDQNGKFYDRRESFKLACDNGQLSPTTKWIKTKRIEPELYLEDIY